jgi:hypothetical protein
VILGLKLGFCQAFTFLNIDLNYRNSIIEKKFSYYKQKYFQDARTNFSDELVKETLLNVISAPEYDKYVNIFKAKNINNFDEAIWNIVSKCNF